MVSYKALNTKVEAVISQTRDGVGNGDGSQTTATPEAVMSQTLDGVAKDDGGQTAAISEALFSQPRDGVGNGDGGQTAATREAVISQTRDGVGNGDGGQTATTTEAGFSQTRDGIASISKNHSFRDYNLSRIIRPPLMCNRSSLIFPIQVIVNPIHLFDICPRGMKSQE